MVVGKAIALGDIGELIKGTSAYFGARYPVMIAQFFELARGGLVS